jgi:diguanylate cyclase (GGDEF)-like protein
MHIVGINYIITQPRSTVLTMTNKLRELMKTKGAIYAAYIVLSCVFTAELNIIHSKFIVGIELTPTSYIMPTAAGILFGYLMAQIKVLSDQMTRMAYTDSLTHIYNRLHFNHFLDAEIDKVKRYGGTFSIIFFDLDHFKQINDTHGHLVGDKILEEVSAIIGKANRSSDIFARYGGEEFVILTASTNIEGAYDHAKRLKQDVEQHQFSIGRVTSSFGVTEFIPETDTLSSLIERADKALYEAKAKGRNCVVKL